MTDDDRGAVALVEIGDLDAAGGEPLHVDFPPLAGRQ